MEPTKKHNARMAQLVRSLETMRAGFGATMHAMGTLSQTTHQFAQLIIADNATYASSTRASALQRSASHQKGTRVIHRIRPANLAKILTFMAILQHTTGRLKSGNIILSLLQEIQIELSALESSEMEGSPPILDCSRLWEFKNT